MGMIAVYIVFGLLAGAMIGYFIGTSQSRKESEGRAADSERLHQEALNTLQRQFDATTAQLKAQMQAATEEMLRRRENEFAQSSSEKINQLLQPLNQNLREMKEAVATNTMKHTELGGRLDANLNALFTQTAAARASAEKLANALKGSNQAQGAWGETVLMELLQSQGLQRGIHFEIQTVMTDAAGKLIKNAEGNFMKPDVVLHLDEERDVIIDSKVSLSAYLDYMEAADEQKKADALEKHVRSIENHVAELVRKDYSGYKADGKLSMGFVIMFVPNDTALMLAMNSRPTLWRHAMEKRVYIADEKTLYAALKIINLTWQQVAQANNHERVYALAEEMLDRVGAFMKSYVEIGAKLEGARDAYESGMKKLQESGKSIPVTCRKLRELGARTSKVPKGVPPELLGE